MNTRLHSIRPESVIDALITEFAKQERFEEVYSILERLDPALASTHLEICWGDRTAAGAALTLGSQSEESGVFTRYLFGNRAQALSELQTFHNLVNDGRRIAKRPQQSLTHKTQRARRQSR